MSPTSPRSENPHAPLSNCTARVFGNSTTAVLLHWHLGALGARMEVGSPCPPDQAAAVELTSSSGLRREAVVEWAGPVPGVVDEATAQAICGIMHVHGRRNGEPRGLGVDYCTTAAGVLASTGLLASLLNEHTRHVTLQTSVAEAALLAVSQYLAAAGGDDAEAVSLAPGGPPFTSADGVRFEVETLQPEPWAGFWGKLGAEATTIGRSWRAFQFRYATATAPIEQGLHDLATRHSFADIVSAADSARVSVCRLRTAAEGASAVGVESRASWPQPWELRPGQRGIPAHRSGDRHSPLAATTVLEAGRRVQAPLAAHVLSLLGAGVTRIEPPGGDPLRGMPPTCDGISARWLALNRTKDAIELDIKCSQDTRRLRQLAEDADVFVHNWAPGKAQQFGLTAAELPHHLVYAYTSATGDRVLPDTPLGTDFMMQARTGMAESVRPHGESLAPSLMTLLDVLGGLLGAEAIVAGLMQRCQQRSGVAVESSLLSAATALQAPLLSAGVAQQPAGFRVPRRIPGGWQATPDTSGDPVPVTTDLRSLPEDPRFGRALAHDQHHCPTVRSPWKFS